MEYARVSFTRYLKYDSTMIIAIVLAISGLHLVVRFDTFLRFSFRGVGSSSKFMMAPVHECLLGELENVQ